jgi:hypothetical protein
MVYALVVTLHALYAIQAFQVYTFAFYAKMVIIDII